MESYDSLRGLARKNNYKYTEEQVDKIFEALHIELDNIKETFFDENSQRFSL
jgi:hypothetical protein